MVARYGVPEGHVVARAIKQSVNLLSVIFAQVYFPTFSNRLKDIGHFLGVKWAGPVTSGSQCLAYRLEWEQSLAPDLKAAIVAYNRDDCAAIEVVTSQLTQIICGAKMRADVEFPDKPKKVASAKSAEVHGCLESLLKSAHFRYSHSRIKLSLAKDSQSLSLGKTKAKTRQPRKSFSSIRERRARTSQADLPEASKS